MITGVKGINFLSFEQLDVTFSKGVTLVDGWNEDDQTPEGCGKSAILNAICWGLFGKIPKDANIDDVIKNGEKSCAVEVHFSDAVVRRARNPNELVLVVEGKSIKGKDAKETQLLIEEFVGLTFETFCQTVYFAQNYTKKFITANQEEKGKILSEVQNLSVFDKAGKEVRELIKLNESDSVKLKHSKELASKDEELTKRDIAAEHTKRQHALQQQEQKVKSLETQILSFEILHRSEYDNQLKRVESLNSQIHEAEKLIGDNEALKAQHLATVANLVYDEAGERKCQEANNQLMSEVGAVNAEIAGIDKLVTARTATETQGKRYAARYKQLLIERDKNVAFIANPSKNCPTCGSRLEACDTSHAETEIRRIDQETSEIVATLTIMSNEIDLPIPTKDELNDKLSVIRQKRAANDAEIQKIRSVKDKLNSTAVHLTGIDRNIKSHRERVSKLTASIEVEKRPLVLDLTELEALKVRLDLESQELTFDHSVLDALVAKLELAQSDAMNLENLLVEKNKHLARLENLKIAFKEIKSHVFNSLLNEVNARVQKFLAHLFEVSVVVRFVNEDMKIETKVKFDGVERGLGLLSGGQFRRVSLAVDLALSDTIIARKGVRLGITIWDEYMKDLSETSMEKVLQLFEARNQPTILIEHNSIFKNIVNNSVFVKLENGTSRVEVQNN